MNEVIERKVEDKIAPPAKRWRNVYKIKDHVFIRSLGEDFYEGDIVKSPGCFPSKEVAEQKALDILYDNTPTFISRIEYLGAEPVP